MVITACYSNTKGAITDKIRLESMRSDTSSFFSVYKNILIGKRPYFSYKAMFEYDDVKSATNTHVYISREAKFYESIGNMYEVYRVLGYGNEVSIYGVSDIKYRCPRVYKSVQESLESQPPYGSLEIDKIRSEDTYVGSLIVEVDNGEKGIEYQELTGWFMLDRNYGVISSVKCVFDKTAITKEGCDKIAKSIISNLSNKYGPKYKWSNPAPYDYENEYAWLVGKYEVHFCTRQGERFKYDSNRSDYEFIIEYVDNASLIRQKEEQSLKQKQKDAGERRKKSIEQKRLKTEYNRSVL